MSDNPEYRRLMRSSRWRRIRAEFLASHPLCHRCEQEGRTKLAEEVHHVVPIQNEVDPERMKALAYDKNNLMALCSDCHHLIHEEMGSTRSWNKEKNRRRGKAAAETFAKEWLDNGEQQEIQPTHA